MSGTPNPGSDEAAAAGCTCPRIDNHRGRGIQLGPGEPVQFWRNADCPLHGARVLVDQPIPDE